MSGGPQAESERAELIHLRAPVAMATARSALDLLAQVARSGHRALARREPAGTVLHKIARELRFGIGHRATGPMPAMNPATALPEVGRGPRVGFGSFRGHF